MRRFLVATALVATTLLVFAAPAGADPARPTNWLSVMTSVSPPTPYVSLRVVGGDGFLDLSVERGHTAEVEGYVGEPYLRVLADGTVELNLNSPAYYLNKSRFGTTKVPAALQGSHLPPPKWKVKGHSGHAVWHDHRIHFMVHDIPPFLASGHPQVWAVNFTVDGVAHVAHGNYRLLHGPNTIIWLALIVLVVAAVIVAGWRRQVLVAALAAIVAAPIGLVLGLNQDAVVPKAAGGSPLIVALPIIALVAGVVGLVRRSSPLGVQAVLAAVACEGGWFLSRTSVLWKTVIPTKLSGGVDRTGSSVLIALAVAAAFLAVRSGGTKRARPAATKPEPASTPA
jgi:hypothetical protein